MCVFGSHTFVPISWTCKKQTAVSLTSTESEIISLGTGLRLDGLPALELWDLIVSVFGSVSLISDRTGRPVNDVKKHQKSQGKINMMENIDSVPSNVQSSRQEALLYVFCLAFRMNLLFLFVEQSPNLCFLVSLFNGSHRSISNGSPRSVGH